MKKYFSPEYTNEVVMANDVITVSHVKHVDNGDHTIDVYRDGDVENATVTAGLDALLGGL